MISKEVPLRLKPASMGSHRFKHYCVHNRPGRRDRNTIFMLSCPVPPLHTAAVVVPLLLETHQFENSFSFKLKDFKAFTSFWQNRNRELLWEEQIAHDLYTLRRMTTGRREPSTNVIPIVFGLLLRFVDCIKISESLSVERPFCSKKGVKIKSYVDTEAIVLPRPPFVSVSVSRSGSSGIKIFQSRDFRDGILHNPGIPGFFGTGLA